jgi:hypothetical protein
LAIPARVLTLAPAGIRRSANLLVIGALGQSEAQARWPQLATSI